MQGAPPGAPPATYKVVLLGEGRVGKTSLVLRYVTNVFSDSQPATLQASYLTKKITIGGNSVNLAIWDTAGQERFHALGPIYYRDADAALLVFDITDVDSFTRVKTWVKELRKMAGKDIVLVLAGNKVDLERSRQVTEEEAQSYALSIGAQLFGTSAKVNRGVEPAFAAIAEKLIAQKPAATASPGLSYVPRGSIIMSSGDDRSRAGSRPPAPKSDCC